MSSVSSTNPRVEDEILLEVVVSGTRKAVEPILPDLTGFQSISSGTAFDIKFINGVTTFKRTYKYILIAEREGDFTINPISIEVDGKKYYTQPIKITVESPEAYFKPLPNQGNQPITNPDWTNNSSTNNKNQTNWDTRQTPPEYFSKVILSKKEAYIREPLIYNFKFFTRVSISNIELTLPDFTGFKVEQLVDQKKYETTVNGIKYVVLEKVLQLTPMEKGVIKIPDRKFTIDIGSNQNPFNFFGFSKPTVQTKHLTLEGFEVRVKDLPEVIPENFTNLVGNFNLEVNLSDQEINQDDSVTLEIKLVGQGNIKDAILPKNIENIAGFKVYPDKPISKVTNSNDGPEGYKIFKMALVPATHGEITLDPILLSYFDPKKEKYIELSSPKLTLLVNQSNQSNDINLATNNNQNNLSEESNYNRGTLAPLKLTIDWDQDYSELKINDLKIFLIFLFLPIGVIAILLLVKKIKNSSNHLSGKNLANSLLKEFHQKLQKINAQQQVDAISLSQLQNELLNSLSILLDIKKSGVTNRDIIEKLNKMLIDESFINHFTHWTTKLEACCYGGKKSDQTLKDWSQEAFTIFKEIVGALK